LNEKINVSKVLNKLYLEKKIPTKEELGLNKWKYADLLDSMLNDELIFGEKAQRTDPLEERSINNDFRVIIYSWLYKIEAKGIDYLKKTVLTKV